MRNTENWKVINYINSITSITKTELHPDYVVGKNCFMIKTSMSGKEENFLIILHSDKLNLYTYLPYKTMFIGSIDRKKYSRESVRFILHDFTIAKEKETHSLIQELKDITKLLAVDGQNTKQQAIDQLKVIIEREGRHET